MKGFVGNILVLAALFAVVPQLGWGVQILYPPDQSYVTRSDVLIVKGDKTPLDGVVIEIKDYRSELLDISSPEYRAAFGDFLIVAPVLDPGKNQIKVEGYAGGKLVESATAEVYYLADHRSRLPQDYKAVLMHTPEQEAVCAPCHNMQPDAKQLESESPRVNPCASCHLRMLDAKNVHGPAGVWQCSYCHQPGSKPGRYQARPGDAKVCNECHEDKVQDFKAKKFVHGPIEAGMCLVCHDPHASNNPAQLIAPVNELCLGCHEDIGKKNHIVRGVGGKSHPLKGPQNPAVPGKEFNCASCHDPHGGATKQYFQRDITSRMGLCQLCHKK